MVLSSVNHLTLTAAIATLRVEYRGGIAMCRGRFTVAEPGGEPPTWPLAFEARGAVGEKLGTCSYGDTVWIEGTLAYITWLQGDVTRHGYIVRIERFQVLMRRQDG